MSTYISSTELKATLNLTGQTFADSDITAALEAASRSIDNECSRSFATATAGTRYYTTSHPLVCLVDDYTSITSLAVDTSDNGSYSVSITSWLNDPANAAADGWPYTAVRLRAASGSYFTTNEQAVKVIGNFGWSATPGPIIDATSILASRLLKRRREAPFGIVTVGIDAGAVMRISRTDPDVYKLIVPYVRGTPLL